MPGRHVAVLGEDRAGDAHETATRGRGDRGGRGRATHRGRRGCRRHRTGAAEAGIDPGRIHHVRDAEEAMDVLRPRLRDGDAVLVKASRGIGLDRLVDGLRLELGESAP
jgi:UDP-N-acetylmuramoyl-tripeptide--D-alanyl-D-alanine ligase